MTDDEIIEQIAVALNAVYADPKRDPDYAVCKAAHERIASALRLLAAVEECERNGWYFENALVGNGRMWSVFGWAPDDSAWGHRGFTLPEAVEAARKGAK